jgi:hypothetical protein
VTGVPSSATANVTKSFGCRNCVTSMAIANSARSLAASNSAFLTEGSLLIGSASRRGPSNRRPRNCPSYLCGDGYCYRATIESIHLDDTSLPHITLLNDTQIGFSFDVVPIKKAGIYYF